MLRLSYDPTRPRFDGTRVGRTPFASSVQLDPESRVLFLSDLHFGDGTATDLFAGQDEALIGFLEERRARVGTIVFLGDVVDLPQAWSQRRVLRAHPKIIRYLRELATAERIIFVRGNHDWAVDYEALFPGVTRTEAVLIGDRTLAWHGHQVDLLMSPGAEDATAKMIVHAIAERAVRRRLVPPLEQHDSRANRIALSFAVAWERVRLSRAGMLRAVGRRQKADVLESRARYLARSVCGDPADIFGATTRTLLGDTFDTILCGHSHEPGVIDTGRGVYANTGTWSCGIRTYAQWSNQRMSVHEVDTDREVGDERYASIPANTTPNDLFDWWIQNILQR